jgi:nucleoside triphosphate diphosphatase
MTAKLIRRHPHVFGEAEAESAGEVLRNWSRIKREERGGKLFGELPENLPSTLYAKKLQTRAARAELGENHPAEALSEVQGACREFFAGEWTEEDAPERIGDVLFAAVDAARALGADPELELRAAADRFRGRIEQTAGS